MSEVSGGSGVPPWVYGFDTAWEGERDRMALAASVLDPITIAQLQSTGVGPGWRCAEVGAGEGSVARWLAGRVAPGGSVLATDLDPRYLEPLAGPGLEIRRHDITTGEALPGPFDLVHARLVLQHLREREQALAVMAGALRPGGVILAEEFDFASSGAGGDLGAEAFAGVEGVIHRFLAATGFDPGCGHRLRSLLSGAGFVDITVTEWSTVVAGGSPFALWYRQSIEALAGKLIQLDLVSTVQVREALALLAEPDFSLVTPTLVSATGHRPALNG